VKTKLPPGHGWAYLGVVLGLGASVAGNVANTVLTSSDVDLRLRIPFAVLWPVFLGIGIEVLTRVRWERNWRTWIARALLVGPVSALSAFMSYLHLHHLMIMSGEPGLAQAVGPLAIDGTLFGCTVALLVTRGAGRIGVLDTRQTMAERVAAMRTSFDEVKQAAKSGTTVPPVTQDPDPRGVPVSPVPFPVSPVPAEVLDLQTLVPVVPTQVPVSNVPGVPGVVPPTGPARRAPRVSVGSWDQEKAVRLVLEGVQSDLDIASAVGIGSKTIQRMRRAAVLLLSDHTAVVPAAWKVPGNLVDLIRTEVSR
jgi:hypothetical protein